MSSAWSDCVLLRLRRGFCSSENDPDVFKDHMSVHTQLPVSHVLLCVHGMGQVSKLISVLISLSFSVHPDAMDTWFHQLIVHTARGSCEHLDGSGGGIEHSGDSR